MIKFIRGLKNQFVLKHDEYKRSLYKEELNI